MLQRALPFQHGPAGEVVLRHLGEDLREIDLPVAQRAEPSGAIHPCLIAAVDARPAVRAKLGILDVEAADAVVIDVEERQIIQLLQDEMAGIVQDVRPFVISRRRQEPFEGDAVVQILARMDFERQIDPGIVERMGDFYAEHPTLVKTIGGAALAVALALYLVYALWRAEDF